MAQNEDTGSPSWTASFLEHTEDVARAFAAAAASATAPHSPRPSVVFQSKDDHEDSGFQKFQRHVTKVIKGLSSPPAPVKSVTYNPEILTSQKRQWASCQLQHLDHRNWKEPSSLFESMVVLGLDPNYDLQALQKQYVSRKSDGSGRLQGALGGQNQARVEPILEPQVLFVYPPGKELPLDVKYLLSYCFPAGLEIRSVEKTPSMSELNEILIGQEHLKQSDQSFVFRSRVADDSTLLYGCCVLVDEIVQKPSGLLSLFSNKKPSQAPLSRQILTTRRCYCILSRLPFFELHFGVLNSIFIEERLERLTKDMSVIDLESTEGNGRGDNLSTDVNCESEDHVCPQDKSNAKHENIQSSLEVPVSDGISDNSSHMEQQSLADTSNLLGKSSNDNVVSVDSETNAPSSKEEQCGPRLQEYDGYVDEFTSKKQAEENRLLNAFLPFLRHHQYESSESSSSFQGSPSEDRNFRSDVDDTETEEASFSGQEDSNDIAHICELAKKNNHGLLRILCEYYQMPCPARGSKLMFHPLEHLQPLEYYKPDKSVLQIAGLTIDLKSCSTSLELAEAHSALMAEEEATALSTWAVACICGSLRLENVLTLFAAALLEKHIVMVCSNLGILTASVLSIIPLIRPFQWHCTLMPILPDDMLEFLDSPVPYIVGVKNKTSEVQSKLSNAVLVDINKNQIKSPTMPQLPKYRELFASLSPYHAKLVGESYLAKKRPIYDCTDVQVEAAKGFLSVLRSYLDSLCSNMRSHTITNVQSHDDKMSLLIRESFIESFPSRYRPFMKLFVDTQLFCAHTDLFLWFIQKQ